MVNLSEKEIVERYEREGWKTLRGGAPDFVFLKTDDSGNITDQVFVEVKSKGDRLTYEQSVYRKILGKLGAKYRVEVVQAPPITNEPNQTRLSQARANPCQSSPDQSKPTRPVPNRAIPSQPIPFQSNPNQSEREVRTVEAKP